MRDAMLLTQDEIQCYPGAGSQKKPPFAATTTAIPVLALNATTLPFCFNSMKKT